MPKLADWFIEQQTRDMRLALRYAEVLHRSRSRYQDIAIYRTPQWGRLLALDDIIMLTEADEFAYHEMLVHPALLACREPRRVLVVGGGDGGAAREALRHGGVEEVVVAELDGEVVAACRAHLPRTAAAFDDARVRVRLGDGAAYVAAQPAGSFDAVLVDAPDPVGHAKVLFAPEFYAACRRVLGPSGVLAVQTDSPYVVPDTARRAVRELGGRFPTVRVCWAVVPTYAGNLWTFTVAALGADPGAAPDPERARDLRACRYWSPRLHQGAFALPAFAERLLDRDGPARAGVRAPVAPPNLVCRGTRLGVE